MSGDSGQTVFALEPAHSRDPDDPADERFVEVECEPGETVIDASAIDASSPDDGDDVLYIVDFDNVRAKDALVQLEHPFYTLSKQVLARGELVYEHNGDRIEIEAGKHGLPTIYDKDIVIYILSQAMRMQRDTGRTPKRLQIRVLHLLEFTGRGSGGKSYTLLRKAMKRLTGVTIRTNIVTGGEVIDDDFHLIERATTRRSRNDPNGRMAFMEIDLGPYLFNAIAHGEVLTLSRDYFQLSRPLERRIYEIARKHCGHQPDWKVGLELLLKKTGSQGAKAKLKKCLVDLEASGGLPEYDVVVETSYTGQRAGACFIRFVNRNPGGRPKGVRRALQPETVETIQQEFGWTSEQVYGAEEEFREYLKANGKAVTNFDTQFVFFAGKRRHPSRIG